MDPVANLAAYASITNPKPKFSNTNIGSMVNALFNVSNTAYHHSSTSKKHFSTIKSDGCYF